MIAKDFFELTVVSTNNAVAYIGDGVDRFFVHAAGLESDINCDNDKDSVRKAYDKWCLQNRVDSTHYSNFGISMQPKEADQEGFLFYRPGYELIPDEKRTPAEKLIVRAEARISEFRAGN